MSEKNQNTGLETSTASDSQEDLDFDPSLAAVALDPRVEQRLRDDQNKHQVEMHVGMNVGVNDENKNRVEVTNSDTPLGSNSDVKMVSNFDKPFNQSEICLLYTSPSPRTPEHLVCRLLLEK